MANVGDTVYPTVEQLRSVGVYIQACGLISGMDYEEGYDAGEFIVSDTMALSITEESAKELGLDPVDLTIELWAPWADATDCHSSYSFVRNMVHLGHMSPVPIHGPHPAHSFTDWVGIGRVGQVSEIQGESRETTRGRFTVEAGTGEAAVKLQLACNYDVRLAAVWEENFPDVEGLPGSCPLIYWYRKADTFHAWDGHERPKGGIWSEPYEAVYAWNGFPVLRVVFTPPENWQPYPHQKLTLELIAKSYFYTDLHFYGTDIMGDTRQTTFEYSSVDHTYTYEAEIKRADETRYYCDFYIAVQENVVPELDRVVSVKIGGWDTGTWEFYEPLLMRDPQVTTEPHVAIKAFEAPQARYRVGGISAIVDSSFLKALWAGDNDHGNVAELTVPFFDHVESPNFEIDVTAAFDLAGFCDRLNHISDAWSCSLDIGMWQSACMDQNNNTLGTWCFDISAPLEVFPEEAITPWTLPVCLRCGSWKLARGVKCAILSDKVVGGKLHGTAVQNKLPYRNSIVCDVHRRIQLGPWSLYQSNVSTGAAGHWRSASLVEFIEPDCTDMYHYAVSPPGNENLYPGEITWAAVREWVTLPINVSVVHKVWRKIAMFRSPFGGVIHYAWIDDKGRIIFNRIDQGENVPGEPVIVDTSGAYDSVDTETDGATYYIIARVSGNDSSVSRRGKPYVFLSHDAGLTWEGPYEVGGTS